MIFWQFLSCFFCSQFFVPHAYACYGYTSYGDVGNGVVTPGSGGNGYSRSLMENRRLKPYENPMSKVGSLNHILDLRQPAKRGGIF